MLFVLRKLAATFTNVHPGSECGWSPWIFFEAGAPGDMCFAIGAAGHVVCHNDRPMIAPIRKLPRCCVDKCKL